MKENKHSKKISKEVLEEALATANRLAEILKPYLLALTPSERRDIPKMGPKTLNFVEKSYQYASENKALLPSYINMEDFDIDFADAHGLLTLYINTKQLMDGIADIQMTAGSEALRTALVFYKSVKVAAAQGVPGTNAIYEELKKRFPGTRKPKLKAPISEL